MAEEKEVISMNLTYDDVACIANHAISHAVEGKNPHDHTATMIQREAATALMLAAIGMVAVKDKEIVKKFMIDIIDNCDGMIDEITSHTQKVRMDNGDPVEPDPDFWEILFTSESQEQDNQSLLDLLSKPIGNA